MYILLTGNVLHVIFLSMHGIDSTVIGRRADGAGFFEALSGLGVRYSVLEDPLEGCAEGCCQSR
jgi:hypothetical protein